MTDQPQQDDERFSPDDQDSVEQIPPPDEMEVDDDQVAHMDIDQDAADESVNGEHEEDSESQNSAEAERGFEDLTLAEAVGLMRRAPLATLRALAAVAQTPVYTPKHQAEGDLIFAPRPYVPPRLPAKPTLPPDEAEIPPEAAIESTQAAGEDQEFPRRKFWLVVQLGARLIALVLAVVGGSVMLQSPIRSEQSGLDVGAPYLLAGFLLWLVAEVIPLLFDRTPREPVVPLVRKREALFDLSTPRLIALAAALITSLMTWFLNDQNMFTLEGVIAWVASIVLWVWVLAPLGWTPLMGLRIGWRRIRLRLSWTLLVLIAIMAVGTYFRFTDLDGTPPEMTSDHVEKLLDVQRVLNGETNVFFANNHGRDAIQFYALALMARVGGAELNFHLLKLLTVIEGLITLPVLWWMGREIIGEKERRLGNVVGLLIASLVAVSYWHEMLSRLGLRIVLTPMFVALVIGFFARGLRYNRRSDFLWAGLALGFGVYAYQAIRMLPVAIVVGVGITLIFSLKTMADRRQMVMNLVALVLVSFAIFVPLFRYSVEYPEDFWRRTSGRLFGDELTQTVDDKGDPVMRVPSFSERLAAFNQNIPVLLDNFRNSLLMYNWKGDVAWINNAPNEPAFDPFTGGLLIVGVAAWLIRMLRRRDAFDWTLLPLILIMMLPSALSIAYPIENPSATRMSGTLPGVYLLAALPLALIMLALPRLIGRIGAALALVGAAGVVVLSYGVNSKTYFEDYRASYIANSLPYSVGAKIMRDFADKNGYGNVFIIAYPYWWDHRALGIDAGNIQWGNTITNLEDVPQYLLQAVQRPGADLRLDMTKDMLFFYSPEDTQTQEWLQLNFPEGSWQNVVTYQPTHTFNIYRIPALGIDGFTAFWQRFDLETPLK